MEGKWVNKTHLLSLHCQGGKAVMEFDGVNLRLKGGVGKNETQGDLAEAEGKYS